MTHHYPILTPWAEEVKEHVGRDWFMFSDIPEHLKQRHILLRAFNAGLVARKKGKTHNGRRMWKVVL